MYNKEIKARFIESLTVLTKTRYVTVFNKTEKYEKKLDKDCMIWDLEEVKAFFKSLKYTSVRQIKEVSLVLEAYVNWASTERLCENVNPYAMLEFEDIAKLLVNDPDVVITKDELYAAVDAIRNYGDKFIVLGLFEGICGERYCELSMANYEDISNGEMKLYSGRVIPVSQKLAKISRIASETYEYTTIGGKTIPINGNGILKTANNSAGTRMVPNVVVQHFDLIREEGILPRVIKPKNIMESGRLDFIKQEMEKTHLPLKEAAMRSKERHFYIYGPWRSFREFNEKYVKVTS